MVAKRVENYVNKWPLHDKWLPKPPSNEICNDDLQEQQQQQHLLAAAAVVVVVAAVDEFRNCKCHVRIVLVGEIVCFCFRFIYRVNTVSSNCYEIEKLFLSLLLFLFRDKCRIHSYATMIG